MNAKDNDGGKVTPIREPRKVTMAELRAAKLDLLRAQGAALELIADVLTGNPELEAAQDLLRTLQGPRWPNQPEATSE